MHFYGACFYFSIRHQALAIMLITLPKCLSAVGLVFASGSYRIKQGQLICKPIWFAVLVTLVCQCVKAVFIVMA